MRPHCTFRVLNGCSWELKGEFGNEKRAKTAEQKIGERPVLILEVKLSHAVGTGPTKTPPQKMASVLCCFLHHFGSECRVSQGRNEESQLGVAAGNGPYGHQSGTIR